MENDNLGDKWRQELSIMLKLWVEQNNYKPSTKLCEELGIPNRAWRDIYGGRSISTNLSYYARIMQRTELSEADPRRIPPRKVNTPRGGPTFKSRAWTEREYQNWLKKQSEQPESPLEIEAQVETPELEDSRADHTLELEEENVDEVTASEMLTPALLEEETEDVDTEEVAMEAEAAEVVTPPKRPARRNKSRRNTAENEEVINPPQPAEQPLPTMGTLIAPFIDAVMTQVGTAIGQQLASQFQSPIDRVLDHLEKISNDLAKSEGINTSVVDQDEVGKLNIGQLAELMLELFDNATKGTLEERDQIARFRPLLGKLFTRVSVYSLPSKEREVNLSQLKEITL